MTAILNRRSFLLSGAALVTGCGGGGSGAATEASSSLPPASPPPPPPPPPPPSPPTGDVRWIAALRQTDGSQLYPALQIDVDNKRCFAAGALDSWTNTVLSNGDGSLSVRAGPAAAAIALMSAAGGYTVCIDYSFADDYTVNNAPSGTFFSMGAPAYSPSGRFEMDAALTQDATRIAPGGGYQPSTLLQALSSKRIAGSDGRYGAPHRFERKLGIRRELVSVPLGGVEPVRAMADAGPVVSAMADRQPSGLPTAIDIGRRAAFFDQASRNVTVHNVTIYPGALDTGMCEQAGVWTMNNYPTILIEGDSFTNNGMMLDALLLETKSLGYIPATWDGAGGRGLNYHLGLLTRLIAANPRYADAILILAECGLDRSGVPFGQPDDGIAEGPWSTADLLTYLRNIRALFRQSNWMLLQSTPGIAAPVAPQYLEAEAAFREGYPAAWTPWLEAAQALGPAATYAANKAAGICPPELTDGPDNIHISWPNYQRLFGRVLAAKVLASFQTLRQ